MILAVLITSRFDFRDPASKYGRSTVKEDSLPTLGLCIHVHTHAGIPTHICVPSHIQTGMHTHTPFTRKNGNAEGLKITRIFIKR